MADVPSNLPGRLGDPAATLETDRRGDPRIIAALAIAGFDVAPGVDLVGPDATYGECLAFCAAMEEVGAEAHPELLAAMPKLDSVKRATQVVKGVDDNDITLHIHEPTEREGAVPCIVHIHGGGMVLATAEDPTYLRWRDSLADAGMVVVGVEFRNGGGRLGNHPFPAGLNDCASAARWTCDNRSSLGVSSIVISGSSGGGNLSLATALKANREGWASEISGVYGMCPYISGVYANPPAELLSLTENDGYMLSCELMGALVKVYDPTLERLKDPLAWPLNASPKDLRGLPPHVISVNELDPLRDEGLAYYRNLLAANVPAIGRTVHGTPHAGDLVFPDIVPDVYRDSVRSVAGFAKSL